jgi:hypothetical protein
MSICCHCGGPLPRGYTVYCSRECCQADRTNRTIEQVIRDACQFDDEVLREHDKKVARIYGSETDEPDPWQPKP